MHPEFDRRGCSLVGLSIDSTPSHMTWIRDIHRNSGIQISFPIISDLDMKISRRYGMISPNVSTTHTVRSVFIIDPDQKIRAIIQYPMSCGRNIGEILRVIDSLQMTDEKGLMTPANWVPGHPCLNPAPKTYSDMLDDMNNPRGYNFIDWYMSFNKDTVVMDQMNQNPMMQFNMNSMMGSNMMFNDMMMGKHMMFNDTMMKNEQKSCFEKSNYCMDK